MVALLIRLTFALYVDRVERLNGVLAVAIVKRQETTEWYIAVIVIHVIGSGKVSVSRDCSSCNGSRA